MDKEEKFYFKVCSTFFAVLMFLIVIIFCCSCTISMNMVSTEGTASDVIDETQSPQNDLKADISVPLSGI